MVCALVCLAFLSGLLSLAGVIAWWLRHRIGLRVREIKPQRRLIVRAQREKFAAHKAPKCPRGDEFCPEYAEFAYGLEDAIFRCARHGTSMQDAVRHLGLRVLRVHAHPQSKCAAGAAAVLMLNEATGTKHMHLLPLGAAIGTLPYFDILHFRTVETPQGHINAGLFNFYQQISPPLHEGLGGEGRLLIHGHSMGGSMSLLLAYMLSLRGSTAHVHVTASAPLPVFSREARDHLCARMPGIHTLVHLSDYFANVPIPSMVRVRNLHVFRDDVREIGGTFSPESMHDQAVYARNVRRLVTVVR